MAEDCLDEKTRAEDILLGALGYGEDSRIVRIERTARGYRGEGVFSDGEAFTFEGNWDLDELEEWALAVLLKPGP